MRKIISALLIAALMAAGAAAETLKDTVAAFCGYCAEYGIEMDADAFTYPDDYTAEIRTDSCRFDFMPNYLTFYNFDGTQVMWSAVAAFRAMGLSERDAYMLYYDLVYADRSATQTQATSGGMSAASNVISTWRVFELVK